MKKKANLAKERAIVKAQKEEQERNARSHTVPSLNALDIPAELALIFNKIEGKYFSDGIKNVYYNICICIIYI